MGTPEYSNACTFVDDRQYAYFQTIQFCVEPSATKGPDHRALALELRLGYTRRILLFVYGGAISSVVGVPVVSWRNVPYCTTALGPSDNSKNHQGRLDILKCVVCMCMSMALRNGAHSLGCFLHVRCFFVPPVASRNEFTHDCSYLCGS